MSPIMRIVVLALAAGSGMLVGRAFATPVYFSEGPVSMASGNTALEPPQGTQPANAPPDLGIEGAGVLANWCAYSLPGEYVDPKKCVRTDPNLGRKYQVAYANPGAQPVQSSDWWVSLGMQWQGWVQVQGGDYPYRTTPGILSEPFQAGFVDLRDWWAPLTPPNPQPPPHPPFEPAKGLSLWNRNDMIVYTGDVFGINGKPHHVSSYPSDFAVVGGNAADPQSPILTVGLSGASPLFPASASGTPPWSNVTVQHYSDWGVEFAYADSGSQLTFTMANGSPFVWAERTAGNAPFQVWAGGAAGNVSSTLEQGSVAVWYNQGGWLGVTVKTAWVPNLPSFPSSNPQADCPNDTIDNGTACAAPRPMSTAAYVVYADGGAPWQETAWSMPGAATTTQALFSNPNAAKVAVLAMPHNVDAADAAALIAAMREFACYAGQRITNTQFHYPPVSGSDTQVTVGGQVETLGYDPANSVVRSVLKVTTEAFADFGAGTNCPASPTALQMVFPHHRKAMAPSDLNHILTTGTGSQPKYTWKSPKGELQAFAANGYVQQRPTLGVLPFLPSLAVNDPQSAAAAEDIYASLKRWFFGALRSDSCNSSGEPSTDPNTSAPPFGAIGGIATYAGGTGNTYLPGLPALTEGLAIADQLANSPNLDTIDPDWSAGAVSRCPSGSPYPMPQLNPNKTKAMVAAEMRDYILQTLKEVIGKWGDVYGSQWFQYNPEFSTSYGFPQGYLSVQSLNDHHFHYGYFLRAAAAIGRYDPAWLKAYQPLFENLRGDIATYDRTDTRYPLLRNFSPFYGHSWADGLANGGNGENQESTSEAINFAVGLIELGQLLGNTQWRDIGVYLYEAEILAIEQYWFNQAADLSLAPTPDYNGNWPGTFVKYSLTTASGSQQAMTNSIIGRVIQDEIDRSTFFGIGTPSAYANSFVIQMVPLSASHLYVGRNTQWLAEAWSQFTAEAQLSPQEGQPQLTPYENLIAGFQAQLPGTGSGLLDPGPTGALARIGRPHNEFQGAIDAQAKHWAYGLNSLGILDSSVVADAPNFGVFCRNGSGSGCQGGTRSFVAYNPSSTPVTVNFSASGSKLASLAVPGGAMATQVGSAPLVIDRLTPPATDHGRLYLTKPPTQPVNCAEDTNANIVPFELSPTPGTWLLPATTGAAFPGDVSGLEESLVCVPANLDSIKQGGDDVPPAGGYVRTWQGQFTGKIAGDPLTRFSIYANANLLPGWQRGVCSAGGALPGTGCPNAGLNPPSSPVYYIVRVRYDFDSNGTDDRIEEYRVANIDGSNSFTYDGKLTEYRTDALMPFSWDRDAKLFVWFLANGQPSQPFPAEIPASQPATVSLDLWGGLGSNAAGATPSTLQRFPIYFSVNADPLTNRASWIKPPYTSSLGEPKPPVPTPSNQPPVAQAGTDRTARVGELVRLDGTLSSDPDRGPAALSYRWRQTGGPAADLQDAQSATPSFVPSAPGRYVFRLAVSDGARTSEDEVSVNVSDVPVVLLSPNGGEVWKTGARQAIRWYVSPTQVKLKRPLKIRLSRNGGRTWTLVKQVSAGAGTAHWTPQRRARSAKALLSVCVVPSDGRRRRICDAGDRPFTIMK